MPQLPSPLCVMVFTLRKAGVSQAGNAMSPCMCQLQHQRALGLTLLLWLHSQLLPFVLGGLIQNADYLAMDAKTSEMAQHGMR